MKYPNHVHVSEIMGAKGWAAVEIGGEWVPARPLGYPSIWRRIQLAWMVFTGKADALIWPEGQ